MVDKSIIELNDKSGDWRTYALEVYNLKGQKVDMNHRIIEGSFEINKGSLSPGMYFYQISKESKKISAGKIIVQ